MTEFSSEPHICYVGVFEYASGRRTNGACHDSHEDLFETKRRTDSAYPGPAARLLYLIRITQRPATAPERSGTGRSAQLSYISGGDDQAALGDLPP